VTRNGLGVGILVLLVVVLAAACGQGESGTKNGGQSASASESASKGDSTEAGEFQGVVDSYDVAQREIEEEGEEQRAGEYRVAYIIEPAEGRWEGDPQNLTWREPAPGETNHIEILPFEVSTGLLVPEADITLTVLDGSGSEVDRKPLSFYRGEFYHYANNFSLPESGTYTLRAEIAPPTFLRHETDEAEGKVFTEPVTAEFENVQIDTEEE
jgi:Fe2+ transport protein